GGHRDRIGRQRVAQRPALGRRGLRGLGHRGAAAAAGCEQGEAQGPGPEKGYCEPTITCDAERARTASAAVGQSPETSRVRGFAAVAPAVVAPAVVAPDVT